MPANTQILRRYNVGPVHVSQKSSSEDDDSPSDEDALRAMERLEALDTKLGIGIGASKERAKLNKIIEEWEEQQQQRASEEDHAEHDGSNNEEDEDDEDDFDGASSDWDATHKYVVKHSPLDSVAIFGGDPSRRRLVVEKKMAPYKSLDQFGTPNDVGISDTNKILQRISSNKYNVVYLWTRFNCHGSRAAIRDACINTGTRFEEVESLAYIRPRE
jgi:hypothetical protein